MEGVPCAVFELDLQGPRRRHLAPYRLRRPQDQSDPEDAKSYSQDGKLQAIYHFKDVKQVAPGIWFPTLIEAENVDRVVAGVTAYKDIRVNTGLSDSIFRL